MGWRKVVETRNPRGASQTNKYTIFQWMGNESLPGGLLTGSTPSETEF